MHIKNIIRFIRKDRALRIVLTALCCVSFVLTAFYPQLAFHNACLACMTNLVWIWEL